MRKSLQGSYMAQYLPPSPSHKRSPLMREPFSIVAPQENLKAVESKSKEDVDKNNETVELGVCR
jgi:hypothetical protein